MSEHIPVGLNYLVKIGDDGRLYWDKNNQPVDTTAGDWKDAGEGRGIVPESMPTRNMQHTKLHGHVPFTNSPITSRESLDQENAATHYAGGIKGRHWWSRYVRRNFTARGVMERLLRKTVRRNTWIYVSLFGLI
ncbi:hypothetical protein JR316_0001092 [Psilocybe cubensis]|uniref:Uncharacterized protein n=1 Tax=Psilocybe cubensis TaxID=181762 RepID=A0ACB8HGG8_PSICU|nr:hypothetical protein JR316_0001092 [Psilocybe cubensis]KAH9487026.1 hypothetical protein JR316_0001092 [Psilocybe cubensis]